MSNEKPITSEDVLTWLDDLAANSGIEGIELSVTSDPRYRFFASLPKTGDAVCAPTADDAIQKLRDRLPVIATKHREYAAELVASAEKIEVKTS